MIHCFPILSTIYLSLDSYSFQLPTCCFFYFPLPTWCFLPTVSCLLLPTFYFPPTSLAAYYQYVDLLGTSTSMFFTLSTSYFLVSASFLLHPFSFPLPTPHCFLLFSIGSHGFPLLLIISLITYSLPPTYCYHFILACASCYFFLATSYLDLPVRQFCCLRPTTFY